MEMDTLYHFYVHKYKSLIIYRYSRKYTTISTDRKQSFSQSLSPDKTIKFQAAISEPDFLAQVNAHEDF